MPDPVLSIGQIEQYLEHGYLLISGLIPDDVVERADQEMWDDLGITPDDPASWQDASWQTWHNVGPSIRACYTSAFLMAALQLGEGDADGRIYRPPTHHSILPIFPREGEWAYDGAHIDHSIKSHGHRTFPHAFRVAAMTYLNDVEPHTGGTVVWPGSHRKIAALARSRPQHYDYMWKLGSDIHQLDLGEPLELTPKRGDVLFYHVFCAHCGSRNVGTRPRFATNYKWE